MVARDHGVSIMNMDKDGVKLAASLHMVVKYLYKANVITLVHAGKMEEIVEKLREVTPSHRSPSPKNTKKRKSTNFQKNGYDSESSQPDEESEYGDDEHQVQANTDDDDEEGMVVESDDDSQSSHNNTGKHENQAVDDVICPDDETDEDHYDPPTDDHTHGYNPTGDICNDLPRLIVKGAGKVYYGVGKKPHSKTDVKKVKGKEVGPKAGDVGFFKMTRMDPETLIRDGTKSVKLNWDYCDFSSGNYSFFIIVTLLI
jgi:Cu/Zn superoxide dismutase